MVSHVCYFKSFVHAPSPEFNVWHQLALIDRRAKQTVGEREVLQNRKNPQTVYMFDNGLAQKLIHTK
jgi:hypothetical protein